jgi:transposase
MSNKNLRVEVLLELRKKAVFAVVKEGLPQNKAAKIFGFSPTSISLYVREYKQYGEDSFNYAKRGVKPNTGSYLTEEETQLLKKTLLTTQPDEHKLDYSLWNSKAICAFISQRFNVTYTARGVRDLLSRMGFSSQKPIRKAYQRSEAKVLQWLSVEYPRIKQRAMQEGARIYWADEMGVQSTDNRGKTYGLVNQTPAIQKTGTRFKINMLAAISPQGYMNWMVFEDNCDSNKFIEFLGRLRRQVKQKVFLIVDNHIIHRSNKVKEYVEKFKSELEIFFTSLLPRAKSARAGEPGC